MGRCVVARPTLLWEVSNFPNFCINGALMIAEDFDLIPTVVCRLPLQEVLHFGRKEICKCKNEFRRQVINFFKDQLFMSRKEANLAFAMGELGWGLPPYLGGEICKNNMLYFFELAAGGLWHKLIEVQVIDLPEGAWREIKAPTLPSGAFIYQPRLGNLQKSEGLLWRKQNAFTRHLANN